MVITGLLLSSIWDCDEEIRIRVGMARAASWEVQKIPYPSGSALTSYKPSTKMALRHGH